MQTRRDFLKAVGLGAAALGLPKQISGIRGVLPGPKRPNIIYIMADDLGYGDLGCYGQGKIKTGNIDKMSAEGIRFTQHYAGSTVCAPSRCSLMTGLHTGRTYIRANREIEPEGQFPIPPDTVTVAKILKKAGYTTGIIGKWGLGGPGSTGEPNKHGFDHWFGYLCQRQAHSYYPEHLWRNGQKVVLEGNLNGARKTYSQDLLTEEALNFIKQNSQNPFFLYLPLTIPHAELAVPADSLNEYKGKFPETPFEGGRYRAQETPRAAYAGMITRMDRDIGRILKQLSELGIEDNTLVMFTSDNGPHGEGGNDRVFFNSSGSLRGMKRDLYEGGIRVPFIARWPGQIRPGTVSNHVCAFWDFLPTCAEIAGAESPKKIDGVSFLPALLGKKQKQHEYLYWEFHKKGGKQAVRMGDFKAVRLNVKKEPDAPIELYNLKDDIGEKNNIADQHPEIVARMKKYFKAAHTPSKEFPMKV